MLKASDPSDVRKASPPRRAVDLLLASMFWKAGDGLISSFLFGRPGYPQQNLGIELEFSRKGLLAAALYVRRAGPRHLSGLPIEDIEGRLHSFIIANFWGIGCEVLGKKFDCSFGECVSEVVKRELAEALALSDIFIARETLTAYPIVPLYCVDSFISKSFFLVSPEAFCDQIASISLKSRIDPNSYPPFESHMGAKQSVGAWLGVRAATNHSSQKIKSAVLGAVALTIHKLERYSFTMRKLFGGYCNFDGHHLSISSSGPHTPPLGENIILSKLDYPWLTLLGEKLGSHQPTDRKQIKALEYYYRAWQSDAVERFPILFTALDAIFGDASAATQAVISAIGSVMGSEYDYDRLRRLLKLRSSVVHGGAPQVSESNNYHIYYVRYGVDPISDLELIVARCFQSVIFCDMLNERPHTHANLWKSTTGRWPG